MSTAPPTAPIPVLLYHAITTAPSPWIAPFTVTPATFARHLDLIAASGRTPLTVRELTSALTGAAPLPAHAVAITFDDGFADLVATAAPLLANYGLPVTAFLTSGFLGRRSPGGDAMLSWAAAGELAAAGHEIGAHSVSHPELDTLGVVALRREVRDCRAELQDRLGLAVDTFAYPHGYNNPAARRMVAQAGYRSACAVKNAFSHPADRIDAIARLTLTATTTEGTLAAWLAGHGAPLARPGDSPASRGWRLYRRARLMSPRTARRQP